MRIIVLIFTFLIGLNSFSQNKPRALIQMATGSGKTFTAVTSIYRLIKFAKAKKILFLVDRSNLGRQALREFQQYATPDDGRKFKPNKGTLTFFNGQTITSQDVLDSRPIADPLRILECVMPAQGAGATIVTTAEKAKALTKVST